ncbi:chemotaxis protein [Acinetobacter sp. ME22]|uniref:chemotaxis protein n=1 Tax=Acinetobacter sp. ME22 TaxID=2904802 RepID=UPI001EDC26AD|nr:chemotaxis protein [Acinetobacter sp. ME22]MCG2573017.1 chemotaxis protein [Acinetobacter sp. ME22]
MSYQTSIHFDPTALLIIKNEVDNSIKLVESAVATLVEEQQLPFGIDDALLQLEQCSQILLLIDQPDIAKIAQYSAELMRKIMSNPQQIITSDIQHLSEGITTLKCYIEFSCVKELNIPQFLLQSLNQLEISLNKPLTREGNQVQRILNSVYPQLSLPLESALEKSEQIHRLYKNCLFKLLTNKAHKLDFEGFKLVGTYVSGIAQQTQSEQYWNLVRIVLSHLNSSLITEPRLRILINLETQMAQFLKQPLGFSSSLEDVSDILSLCITQDNHHSDYLRQQLNVGDEILSDSELYLYRKQLFGPDQETIHTVCDLLSDDITILRKDIEFNYTTFTEERTSEIKQQLVNVCHTLTVLNQSDISQQLADQLKLLKTAQDFQNEQFTQALMNSLLTALNDLGLLIRQYRSNLLQYPVNNANIALDRLDNAYKVLVHELKALVDLSSQSMIAYAQSHENTLLENLASQFREIAGAVLFLLQYDPLYQAFINCAEFIEEQVEANKALETTEIQRILDVCASADMLIETLHQHHPIMYRMFDVAFHSSQKLKSVA